VVQVNKTSTLIDSLLNDLAVVYEFFYLYPDFGKRVVPLTEVG
jgi:hypothetical protein